jgi:hypothetical protein
MGTLSPSITLRGELLFELTVFLLHLPGIDGMLDQGEGLVDG